MVGQSPLSTVLEYVEYINAGDAEGVASLTAEEFKFTDIAGRVEFVRGREFTVRFREEYFTPYPDYRIHVHHVLQGETMWL